MLQRVHWISALGWYHLVVFLVVVPFLAIRSRAKLKQKAAAPPLDRIRHFRSTAMMLVLLGALSVLTARDEGIDLFARAGSLSWQGIAAAVLMYVVAVAAMRPRWRRAVEKRLRIVHLFMPSNTAERVWWVVVSVLAGVSEEISWRGVQPIVLDAAVGSAVVAVVLSAAAFGAGHIIQGWRSAVIIGVFALGFQAIVWLTGSLYPAMMVHVAYDVTAGLAYGRLGRELGYRLDPAPPPTDAAV